MSKPAQKYQDNSDIMDRFSEFLGKIKKNNQLSIPKSETDQKESYDQDEGYLSQ